MRTIRLTMAAVATAAVLIAVLESPAGTQPPPRTAVDQRCNAETGEYEITMTIQNRFDETAEAQGDYSWSTVGGGAGDGTLMFSPNPVGANGTSASLALVPGDTIAFDATIELLYSDFIDVDEVTVELAGDCSSSNTPTTDP